MAKKMYSMEHDMRPTCGVVGSSSLEQGEGKGGGFPHVGGTVAEGCIVTSRNTTGRKGACAFRQERDAADSRR